jgi:hypothetical protein
MSQIDENKILDRLKNLSQVEPTKEASERAVLKVRDDLIAGKSRRVGPALSEAERVAPPLLINRLMKLAAAAVLMIGAGFIGGRLSAPKLLDVHQLQAAMESSLKSSLEPTIRRQLQNEFENRLQSALSAERDTLKQELARQVQRDLETFAGQTLTTVGNLMDQRFMSFARMVEEARIKDRQHVAAAFDYMGSRFGDGLETLAGRTDNLLGAERAGSTPDISEN